MATRNYRTLLFSLLTVFFSATAALAQVPQTEFMIGTWGDPPLTMTDPIADSLTLDSVRQAGFNFFSGAGLVPHSDTGGVYACTTAYRYGLERLSRTHGLKMLVMDHRIQMTQYNSVLAHDILLYYRSLPDSLRNVFLGYHVGDEPQDTWLPELRKWIDTLYTYDSTKIPYSGLFPSFVYDLTRYQSYVNIFLQNKSPILGYDDYPFFASQYGSMRATYYQNLQILAQSIASYPAKNFWATVYATEHGFRDGNCNITSSYAPITAPLLKYVAHAPLAYGAKGIMYYRYTWRYTAPCDGFFFKDGIRQDSKQYQWVQAQNLKMLHLGPVLMRLKWLAAVHGSATNAYSSETVPVITSGTPVLKSIGYAQALIGLFCLKDSLSSERFLLIMNKDTSGSHAIPVTLRGGWRVESHNETSSTWDAVPGAGYLPDSSHTLFSLTLPAAEIALIRLTPDCGAGTCTVNLAMLATLSASSNAGSVSNVVDGVTDQDFSRWGSENTDGPHWIAMTWEGPVKISNVQLWTGAMWGAGYQIQDFVLQHYDQGSWVDLPGTSVINNPQDGFARASNVFTFDTLVTTGLRLYITDGCVSSLYKNARVFEMEVTGAALPAETRAEADSLPGILPCLAVSPNPFNPSTRINYELPQPQPVELAVFDMSGRLVRLLVSQAEKAGKHSIEWNGYDQQSRLVNSGVYLIRLKTGNKEMVRRAVLIR